MLCFRWTRMDRWRVARGKSLSWSRARRLGWLAGAGLGQAEAPAEEAVASWLNDAVRV